MILQQEKKSETWNCVWDLDFGEEGRENKVLKSVIFMLVSWDHMWIRMTETSSLRITQKIYQLKNRVPVREILLQAIGNDFIREWDVNCEKLE